MKQSSFLYPITVTPLAYKFLNSHHNRSNTNEAVIPKAGTSKLAMENARRNLFKQFDEDVPEAVPVSDANSVQEEPRKHVDFNDRILPDVARSGYRCAAKEIVPSKEHFDEDVPEAVPVSDANSVQEEPPKHVDFNDRILPDVTRPGYRCAAKEIVPSKEGGRKSRRQFCIFCKKLLAKLPNHIEAVHKQEEVVKRLKSYPKGHPVRQAVLQSLRRRGAAEYNSNRAYNNGIIVPARRPNSQQDARHFLQCPRCFATLQTTKLSRHMQKCDATFSRAENVNKYYCALARKTHARTHVEASDVLKGRVLPFLRSDNITEAILYDRLAIYYGNKQCSKYASSTHHDRMIRCNLRQLARLLLQARELNPAVTNLQSLMTPAMHATVVEAIQNIAGFSPTTGIYRAPSTATLLTGLVKKVAADYEAMCIQDGDKVALEEAKSFLPLFLTVSCPVINKTVEENRIKLQRRKNIVLPNTSDVNKLSKYLRKCCDKAVSALQKSFSYSTWKLLGAYVMSSIIILNRRRPGEMERMELDDYASRVQTNENALDYESLSTEDRNLASRVQLYLIRGKLNRTVSVVIFDWMREAIDVFLSHRERAGVPDSNPYLFGLPGGGGLRPLYINIGIYFREFSVKCGAANPMSLRATILRKHLATASASQHGGDATQIRNLAGHLGHADDIHTNIYMQKTINKPFLQVVKLLQHAQGDAAVDPAVTDGSPAVDSCLYVADDVHDEQARFSPQPSTSSCSRPPQRKRTLSFSDGSTTSESDGSSDECIPATRVLRSKRSTLPVVLLERLPSSTEKRRTKSIAQLLKTSTKTSGEKKKQRSKDDGIDCPIDSTRKKAVPLNSSPNRWSKEQEVAATEYFGEYIENRSCPSFKFIEDALSVPQLSDKSLPVLRQWILDKIAGRSPRLCTPRKRRFQNRDVKQRLRWTPSSISALHRAFASHITSKKLPSLPEIRKAKILDPHLRSRSSPVIKSKISNILRYC